MAAESTPSLHGLRRVCTRTVCMRLASCRPHVRFNESHPIRVQRTRSMPRRPCASALHTLPHRASGSHLAHGSQYQPAFTMQVECVRILIVILNKQSPRTQHILFVNCRTFPMRPTGCGAQRTVLASGRRRNGCPGEGGIAGAMYLPKAKAPAQTRRKRWGIHSIQSRYRSCTTSTPWRARNTSPMPPENFT